MTFFQLLLDVLSYSAASFSALARNSISNSMELMLTTENFIQEQLNLIKDSLSEIKVMNVSSSMPLRLVFYTISCIKHLTCELSW